MPRLQLRVRAASAEDALVLADEQRSVLAGLRLQARGAPDGVPLALREARVKCAGGDVVLDLPASGPLLRWLCHKGDCDLPLRSLLSWHLGAEQRESLGRAGEVLRRLQIAPGEQVADVGAGPGFFTTRLARAVGATGRVFAVEIDPDLVAALRERAAEAPYPQVQAVLGAADDPRLPPQSLDAVLIVDAYHEMPQHGRMLEAIRGALRAGGRLLLVEPFAPAKKALPREQQEREHVLDPELARRDLIDAGFQVLELDQRFVELPEASHGEWLLLARRPRE